MLKSARKIMLLTALLSLLAPVLSARPAFADWSGNDPSDETIMPQYRTDLPSNNECTTLGYDFGFKIEGADNGTYLYTEAFGDLQPPGTPDDPGNSVTISNSDGQTFDWASTLDVDAVVVKAGTGANVYAYDPALDADGNLHAPLSGSGPGDPGSIRDISHIAFCFGAEAPQACSITIVKHSHSKKLAGIAFEFETSFEPAEFSLEIGESRFFELAAGGTYNVTELVPDSVELSSIACQGAVESLVTIGETGGFQTGDTSVTIVLEAGEDIVCTFIDDPIEPPPTGTGSDLSLLLGALAIAGGVLLRAGASLRARGARPA